MITFSAPSRFDPREPETIAALNREAGAGIAAVRELHGSLPRSIVGSGRVAYSLPEIDADGLAKYVAAAHGHGVEFNYLLNAPCMGNQEFTCEGVLSLNHLFDLLVDTGIDWVTVTIPFLIDFIRKRGYPVKINASVIAQIDNVPKARFFNEMGVDRITLSTDVNRNFSLLRALRREIAIPLELLVNSACLPNCPYSFYHYSYVGHHSQLVPVDPASALPFEYCLNRCYLVRLRRRELLVRRNFIRPEDIGLYEDLGIDLFKIQGRDLPASSIRSAVIAYLTGRYDGNMSVLLGEVPPDDPAPIISIDNRALDGFLDFFVHCDYPCNRGCTNCGHCDQATARALLINENAAADYCANIQRKFESALVIDRLVEEQFQAGIKALFERQEPACGPRHSHSPEGG